MRYYVIAGEASGDLHGSNLLKEIMQLDAVATVRCWGGDKMAETGAELVKHYRDLAFMGFAEVIKNLPTIMRNFSFCKKDIRAFAPDVVILIDYPGFNLRMAEWAHKEGLRVIYYISPQVWAWKENRVKAIKRYVDEMLVILPFEKEFYAGHDMDVQYVGHPLVKVIDDFQEHANEDHHFLPGNQNKIIAILPGSRKQEIEKKLPVMLSVASFFPDYDFVVAKAASLDDNFYSDMMPKAKNIFSVANKTYSLLNVAKAALVTSGTATLETALFSVPQVICYKGSALSYEIAKRLIKIKFIGLVNLIMNKEVVKELIQHELTTQNLRKELEELLTNNDKKREIQEQYRMLKHNLSLGGNASQNAAKRIIQFLKNDARHAAV